MTKIPNDIDNISETLERQLIIRAFNKRILGMEESTGTALERIIGIGMRTDPETGRIDPVTNSYQSWSRQVIHAFEMLPITKYFGLTYESAMRLPVDQWFQIRKSAIALAQKNPPELQDRLLELLKEMLVAREATGGM